LSQGMDESDEDLYGEENLDTQPDMDDKKQTTLDDFKLLQNFI